jgi:hypothetical protein
MTGAGWAQLVALIVVIGVTAPLLGRYMANVYEGGPSRLDRVFGPVERLIYRVCRIDPDGCCRVDGRRRRCRTTATGSRCRACWNAVAPVHN